MAAPRQCKTSWQPKGSGLRELRSGIGLLERTRSVAVNKQTVQPLLAHDRLLVASMPGRVRLDCPPDRVRHVERRADCTERLQGKQRRALRGRLVLRLYQPLAEHVGHDLEPGGGIEQRAAACKDLAAIRS